MIRFLSVVVLALALSLAGCSSGGNVEAPKAPAAGASKSTTAGCTCGDKPQGSRPDCACKDKVKADCACKDTANCACKDKVKTESPACKSCDKAGTGACPATGASETKTPDAEKK